MIIDVFQDVVCPWCRIGKAHLSQAIAAFPDEYFQVRHRPFMLNPTTPPEGYDFKAYMSERFGGDLTPMFERPTQAGAAAGLVFDFDAITHSPNTRNAHRLIMSAPMNAQDELIDDIYTAYFQDGRDIGDVNVLADIAAKNGLDRENTLAFLQGDELGKEVDLSLQMAQQMGVQGVPLFILDQKVAFSGAQPVATMIQAIQQVLDEAKSDAE